MSVDTKRARELVLRQGVIGHADEARKLLEALANEVDLLNRLWVEDSHLIHEYENEISTQWKPLLAAAKGFRKIAGHKDIGSCVYCEAIAACEEKP